LPLSNITTTQKITDMNFEIFGVVAILATITYGVIMFVRTITGYYLRKRMVDKGYVDDESVALLTTGEKKDNRMATLKWGLVVFFGGLSLVVLEYINYDYDSPLPYGLFILSISFGLLLHFFISGNMQDKE
jgi:hypothetical protein